MVMSAVSSTSATGDSAPAGSKGNVALSSTLSRCQQQLGDWMACPSSKTPEGKKIIDNLRIRIARLEDQVARSRPSRAVTAPVTAPPSSTTPRSSAARNGTLGSLINVYA